MRAVAMPLCEGEEESATSLENSMLPYGGSQTWWLKNVRVGGADQIPRCGVLVPGNPKKEKMRLVRHQLCACTVLGHLSSCGVEISR